MKKAKTGKFALESEMCAQFISEIGDEWVAYPETAGFDILLVRKADGCQIGVEAKLKFNSSVLSQILESGWHPMDAGPDYRAILVPYDAASTLNVVAGYIGITVIRIEPKGKYPRFGNVSFTPNLPKIGSASPSERDWYDWCPTRRCDLPDYIPDVVAGAAAPVQLSKWKIGAIKIAIILEERGWVARQDFKHVGIDCRRWIARESKWLKKGEIGWVADKLPDFKLQHPVVYEKIKADMPKWFPPTPDVAPRQRVLFSKRK